MGFLGMRWPALAVIAVVVVIASCGGSGGPPEPPALTRATAERQVDNGLALQRTVITLEFEAPVYNGKRDEPASSYFHLEVASAIAADGTETLSPSGVRVDGATVSLTINQPVPVESTLSIDGGFFGREKDPPVETTVASSLSAFQATLAAHALTPTSPDIVTAGGPPPVTGADRDPVAMRQALVQHMVARGSTGAIVARAEDTFDNIDPAVVPSPKLRAAIASLNGSFAEPAITYLFSDVSCVKTPVVRIDFEDIPDGDSLLARVIYDDAGNRIIVLSPALEGERFELLMPLIAHEAIHCDREDSAEEEIAATAFDVLLYAQLLTVDPTIALQETPLSRVFNLDLITMINSGRRYPESLGVLPSDGIVEALPGSSSTVGSFAEHIANAYQLDSVSDPTPEILSDVYAAVLADTVGLDAGEPFDLVYLDQLIGLQFDPQSLADVVVALTLQP